MFIFLIWFVVKHNTILATPPIRVEPPEKDAPSVNSPQSPSDYHIYCIIEDGNMMVYSIEPLCGEIIANDASSGENLCEVTTDLGASYSFYVGSPRTVDLYVIVDGITYYCEITSN